MKRLLVFLLLCGCLSAMSQSIQKYEYWFDGQAENKVSGTPQDGVANLSIDVSHLQEGVHTFIFRAADAQDNWSSPTASFFLRTPKHQADNRIERYEFWFDNNTSTKTATQANGVSVDLGVDVSSISEGIHTFTFRVQDSWGQWSVPVTQYFLKVSTIGDNQLTCYEYWIDNNVADRHRVETTNGLIQLDLDVNSLLSGVHALSFRMADSRGQWSAPLAHYFVKPANPIKDNKILGYQYWFNDVDRQATYVALDAPASPAIIDVMLEQNSLQIKVTPQNIALIDAGHGKYNIGVRNVLRTRFEDSNHAWSSVQTDSFVIDMAGADLDLTAFITNPDAVEAWRGWTTTGNHFIGNSGHYSGNDNNYFCLRQTASMKQRVSGLPAGSYMLLFMGRASSTSAKVSANGFSSDINNEEWGQHALAFTTDGSPFEIEVSNNEALGFVYVDDFTLITATERQSIVLTVLDDQGNDVTSAVTVQWYDAENTLLGTGNTITGVKKDSELYYSVLLNEDLGRVYREVSLQKVSSDSQTQVCQLKKIDRVMLEGRVSATDIDKIAVSVTVRQVLNGKYEQTYSTQTNEQGIFKVEVYDDETDITISGDGYFDATFHLDGFGGNGNVGTIPMSMISGFAIAANIIMQNAVTAGETGARTVWTDGFSNIEFTLTNTTRGTAISDFTVQGGNIIIRTGVTIGDEVCLVAKSKQDVFADATTTFTIVEGANAFELLLTEKGGMDVVCASSANSGTIGYVYNGKGVLVTKGSYTGETLNLRHLPNGSYTLISMGRSQLLGNLTQLSDLGSIGLCDGTDYVSASVNVTDGEITPVTIDAIPRLNEERFYYTTGNTYFNVSNSLITAGNFLTFSTHMDFKEEYANKVDNVTILIDLPEGFQMVENSVIANRQPVAYTMSGNQLVIPLTKEQYESQVRFCVTPLINKDYTITALALFDVDGQVQQPVGTAKLEVRGLGLIAPESTISTNITVRGTAKGHSEVSVYDNDVFIGKTTSKADGTWSVDCELYKPFSHSFHEIYAKIATEEGMELTSVTKVVEYDKNRIVLKEVTMTHYNRYTKRNENVSFYPLTGRTSNSSYSFYTAAEFTFLADFTRNDTAQIKNVRIIVRNSNGSVRTLPATFDEKQNKWVATSTYSRSYCLPENVTAEYDYVSTMSDEDREEALMDQAANLTACMNHIQQTVNENFDMTLIEESEDALLFSCKAGTFNSEFKLRIEEIAFSIAQEEMRKHQFVYQESEDEVIGTYLEYENSRLTVTAALLKKEYAYRITLLASDSSNGIQPRRAFDIRPKIEALIETLKVSFGNGTFLNKFGEYAGLLGDILSLSDYLSIKSDYNNMCNTILNYLTNYEKIRRKCINQILSKCPDGTYRLSDDKRNKYYNALNGIADVESAFAEQYYVYLQVYQTKVYANVLTYFATYMAGKAFDSLSGVLEKWKLLEKINPNANIETTAGTLSNLLGMGFGYGADKIFEYKDFINFRDETQLWASNENNSILQSYIALTNAIKNSYKKCTKNNNDDDDDTDDDTDFPTPPSKPILDPSGYVYEAVMSNRLEGVTTTCYEQVNGEAVLWDAEDYSQQNPLVTDEIGFYRWDVPQGMWQVKYEKEGYETAYSEWLPVPPPQLDVNIGMKQSTPPTVKQMRGTESGITITMGKYMRPQTMGDGYITVTRNGMNEKGHLEMLDMEQEPKGSETFVSKVKFVPEFRFKTSDEVYVTVSKDVESYCGVKMGQDHREKVVIESEITDIVADSAMSVAYQGTKDVQVLVLPKEASAGRTLTAQSSSPMIASLSQEQVVIDESGLATLTLNGDLPGGVVLTLSVDGTDVEKTAKVSVVIGRELISTPVASIRNGERVEPGTKLALTCDTEGATIYYTLDGSCPCNTATRRKYTEPFTLPNGVVTVKAMAEIGDGEESDVVTFIYTVGMNDKIRSIKTLDDYEITYVEGAICISGARGATCHIYDLQGRELGYRQQLGDKVSLRVAKAESYIVCITTANGQTVVRKVSR